MGHESNAGACRTSGLVQHQAIPVIRRHAQCWPFSWAGSGIDACQCRSWRKSVLSVVGAVGASGHYRRQLQRYAAEQPVSWRADAGRDERLRGVESVPSVDDRQIERRYHQPVPEGAGQPCHAVLYWRCLRWLGDAVGRQRPEQDACRWPDEQRQPVPVSGLYDPAGPRGIGTQSLRAGSAD